MIVKKQRIKKFLKQIQKVKYLSDLNLTSLSQKHNLKLEDIIYPMLKNNWFCHINRRGSLEYYKLVQGKVYR